MADWKDIASVTLAGNESGALTFPQTLSMLSNAGFDGYLVDFRRAARSCYMRDGRTVDLKTAPVATAVAEGFDAGAVTAAIRDAQALVSGYTYQAFCERVAAAGCAGYLVSISGRRATYFGRSGEVHTEYFPGAGT